MSGRLTHIDYAADTPASEQSVYFDAPIAVFNSEPSDGPPDSSPGETHTTTLPGAYESEGDVSTKPSVGVPRDPVVRKRPSEGDEEEHAIPKPDKEALADDVDDAGNRPSDTKPKAAHHRSASAGASDSGYGSTGAGPQRPHSRASQASTNIEPIPILWHESPSKEAHQRGQAWQRSLDDDDAAAQPGSRHDSPFKRASSLRSFRSAGPRASMGAETEDRASLRTSPSTARRRRVSLSGGSFAGGAGTVGPAASPTLDDSFDVRSRTAEMSLSEKQKSKLNKSQLKEGKKVAKIIKAEGKAEKKALEEAVKELADIQKLQKNAVKEEAKSYAIYAKGLREFHKAELEFFAARAKYERAQAELQALEEAREAAKQHAQEATEMLQEKNREVEWLRAQKATDDREREAKIRQLTGKA
ncbi:hypothetical protein BN946_scf185015.g37 [Trametes cinnabarina]|uniref:DNA binding protein Ncp1 n=1 Tax=Pycnoporus cinnabarinus TaxID=5643 RepID=A0A060SNA3_PYCCI|nr:hypothetical protein BN946_scf185015.g37 [Trametes cinnabarina]